MTLTWHWATKETGTQEELAKMVSDITQNFVVTGLTPSDGGGINLSIAAGYARCEGWRIVSDGETFTLTASNDTYYIYLELTLTGDKVASVAVTEYTSEQSLTNRVYLCSVTVIGAGDNIGVVTDNRNLFAIVPSLVQIYETTGLDDWRHTSDLSKIDGAEIYTGSIPWATVIKTGSNLNEIVTRSHTVLSSIGSNTHAQIDTHVTAGSNHFSDTSNPHGSTMSVSVEVTTPKIYHSSGILIQTPGNLTLSPGGQVIIDDDVRIDDASILMRDGATTELDMYVDSNGLTINAVGGGVSLFEQSGSSRFRIGGDIIAYVKIEPSSHNSIDLGNSSSPTWKVVYGCTVSDISCSEHDVPANAFAVLSLQRDLLIENCEVGKFDSKNYPEVLKVFDVATDKTIPRTRNMSTVMDYLLFAMGDIQDEFDAKDAMILELQNQLVAMDLRLKALEPP